MELRGNLKDFSLPDIIQLVGFGRKTGVLRVDCRGGAALYFEDGNVVHAEYSDQQGEGAVYNLFAVPHGEFRFQASVLPPERTITMDPTNLVMEAARLLDEAHRNADSGGTEWSLEEEGDAEWFGLEEDAREAPTAEPRDPKEIKEEIRSLLRQRFGRGAKRLLKAVDQCGDSVEELLDLADRVEKYVHVFLDSKASMAVGREIRNTVGSKAS